MFTGIVEEIGTVQKIQHGASSAVLQINANLICTDLKIGDSVAVNGVCLTATKVLANGFLADAMPETLNRSNLAALTPGSRVNLERALTLAGRVGGHLVSGHIDGTATVIATQRDDNAVWYRLAAPPQLMRYIITKGSVALDGVSLTVARVTADDFSVSLIPHTAANTTFGTRRPGDKINLECDIIGKYVEKLLAPTTDENTPGGITAELLTRCGFM